MKDRIFGIVSGASLLTVFVLGMVLLFYYAVH
jgi:hypothetical protein